VIRQGRSEQSSGGSAKATEEPERARANRSILRAVSTDLSIGSGWRAVGGIIRCSISVAPGHFIGVINQLANDGMRVRAKYLQSGGSRRGISSRHTHWYVRRMATLRASNPPRTSSIWRSMGILSAGYLFQSSALRRVQVALYPVPQVSVRCYFHCTLVLRKTHVAFMSTGEYAYLPVRRGPGRVR
jgi:hypothetical protein